MNTVFLINLRLKLVLLCRTYNPPQKLSGTSALFLIDKNEKTGFKLLCNDLYDNTYPVDVASIPEPIKGWLELKFVRLLINKPDLLNEKEEFSRVDIELSGNYEFYHNLPDEVIKNKDNNIAWRLTPDCFSKIKDYGDIGEKKSFVVKNILVSEKITVSLDGKEVIVVSKEDNSMGFSIGFSQVIWLDKFELFDTITAGKGRSQGQTGTANGG